MAKDQRFFLAVFTGSDDVKLRNRIIGLFSNQTELLNNTVGKLKEKGFNVNDLYLKGARKNLPVTNGNVALEFKRDNHLIIYRDDRAFIKVDVQKMNQIKDNLIDKIF